MAKTSPQHSSMPLVSVLVNNYNYGRFLAGAIDSALNQSYRKTEVVVVDDGSTDNSREVISRYGNRVTAVLKPNGGQGSAFNAGFLASRGEIVCFLDADDRFHPEKVSTVVHTFRNYPECGWCFHPVLLTGNAGDVIEMRPAGVNEGIYKMREAMLRRKPLPFDIPVPSGLCMRRSVLARILPMPERAGISLSDYYLRFATVYLSAGYYLPKALAQQLIHGDNRFTGCRNEILRAQIYLETGYHLRAQFPELASFANGMLAVCMARYPFGAGLPPQYRALMVRDFRALDWSERVAVCGRAASAFLRREWRFVIRRLQPSPAGA